MSAIEDKELEKIVLQCAAPGAKIVGYRLEPFSSTRSGIMGNHYSLSIELEEVSSKRRTLGFFVKRLPEWSNLRDSVFDELAFYEEIKFYSHVHPDMRGSAKWSPACHFAMSDTLVLEDLRSQGYATRSSSIYDEATLSAAVTTLAHFHASSIVAERRLAKTLDRAYPEAFREKIFTDVGKGGRSTKLGFHTLELLAERFQLDGAEVPRILKRIYELVKPIAGGCNTLCHGDLWRGNILFKDSVDGPECLLVDFQMLRYASPCLDLAMLLYVHANPETRARSECLMLERYCATFREAVGEVGTDVPDCRRIMEDYRARRIVGMACAALRWPAAVVANLGDSRALESWYFGSRIETYCSLMDADRVFEATMRACLVELIDEGKRIANYEFAEH
ncbi:PREDICTED: uncharacterized protein LOC105365542 [Ceratosolen solmsi marchali]|uniref:Uncharacterized protein LOC105365542 n=1 Tax=Ceratosolen solmsi marchali TaxID=326594 RepID=A0AAJ7DZD8_9HYME|nr:PREDICTED: uncharacterized protein LOC105365542 [Ceratosolen solmsi marchali]